MLVAQNIFHGVGGLYYLHCTISYHTVSSLLRAQKGVVTVCMRSFVSMKRGHNSLPNPHTNKLLGKLRLIFGIYVGQESTQDVALCLVWAL